MIEHIKAVILIDSNYNKGVYTARINGVLTQITAQEMTIFKDLGYI